MNRTLKPDAVLDKLIDERDEINIQISLLREAAQPDQARMQRLQRKAENLDKRMAQQRRSDA